VNKKDLPLSTVVAVVDTGSTNITMPQKEFDAFIDQLNKLDHNCSQNLEKGGAYICKCETGAKFPPLMLQISKHIYQVDEYVKKEGDSCKLKIQSFKFEEG
jgi:hypothetical protein